MNTSSGRIIFETKTSKHQQHKQSQTDPNKHNQATKLTKQTITPEITRPPKPTCFHFKQKPTIADSFCCFNTAESNWPLCHWRFKKVPARKHNWFRDIERPEKTPSLEIACRFLNRLIIFWSLFYSPSDPPNRKNGPWSRKHDISSCFPALFLRYLQNLIFKLALVRPSTGSHFWFLLFVFVVLPTRALKLTLHAAISNETLLRLNQIFRTSCFEPPMCSCKLTQPQKQ